MTQENKETVFGNRTAKPRGSERSEAQRNNKLAFDVRQIRPTIQFVLQDTEQSEVPSVRGTTEARLKDVRESMTYTRAKKTIRRTGWYFTEPYAPCGAAIDIPAIRLERERYV